MTDWLSTEIPGYHVERHEVQRPGGAPYVPVKKTGKGVMHTTEGITVDGALGRFDMEHWAPTFCCGNGRIVQCRPLSAQASTLHDLDNANAQVQIEAVGFSKESLWLFDSGTLNPVVALVKFLVGEGIPLVRPSGWKDDCSDCSKPLAAYNSRRKSNLYFTGPKGWYMHMECPNESPTWHWDCGALEWTKLFALVGGGDDVALDPVKDASTFKAMLDEVMGTASEMSWEMFVIGCGDAVIEGRAHRDGMPNQTWYEYGYTFGKAAVASGGSAGIPDGAIVSLTGATIKQS